MGSYKTESEIWADLSQLGCLKILNFLYFFELFLIAFRVIEVGKMILYTKSLYRSNLMSHLYLLNLYFLPVL